jgi:hypothetical protein
MLAGIRLHGSEHRSRLRWCGLFVPEPTRETAYHYSDSVRPALHRPWRTRDDLAQLGGSQAEKMARDHG